MKTKRVMDHEVRWRVVFEMILAWLVALPISAIIAYIVYSILANWGKFNVTMFISYYKKQGDVYEKSTISVNSSMLFYFHPFMRKGRN